MHARIFSTKITPEKSLLEASVEWHTTPSPIIQKQIIATHVSSFLDIYQNHTEEELSLKPGITKEAWLTKMITDELEEIKLGKLFLATISLQDTIAGFIVCTPVKARHENLKTDVYLSLLAVKPFRYFESKSKFQNKNNNKIHIGLGKKLIESVEEKFCDANSITLDTRLINKPAMTFYKRLGFNSAGKHTFGGSDAKYYAGYEKSIMRKI